MKNKTKMVKFVKKSFALIAAAVLVFTFFALSGCKEKPGDDIGSSYSESLKTVNFKIVFEDKEEKTVQLNTEKETLAEALVEAGIIKYESSGFYTTIDSVTADYSKDGSWWCITKSGEMLNYGLNDIVIKDGESYEATYTK